MFFKRSNEKEIMDDFSIKDSRIENALVELRLVNKFLGGISTSFSGLKYLINKDNNHSLKILDVGSGGSDIFQCLSKKFPGIKVYSLDRNREVCRIIKFSNLTTPIFGDALILPIRNNSISIVHASLFFHHLSEEEIKNIIKESLNIAVNGVIINDLRRSVWALTGISTLTRLLSKSEMVKNDAPLSVKKGFIKSELISILKSLNITDFKLKRKWAFRWLVVIPKKLQ